MSPARIRRIVDLPHPEGPSSAITSLPRTDKLMFSRTRKGLPLGNVNSCQTSRTSQSTSRAAGAVASAVMVAFSALASFVQGKPLLGEIIAAAPDRPIEQHDHR